MRSFLSTIAILSAGVISACGTGSTSSEMAAAPSSAAATGAIAVPPTNVLAAARSIQPQTGPWYRAEGTFECEELASETPPYGSEAKCQIYLSGKAAFVTNAKEITSVLKAHRPATGPFAKWTGSFTALSISSETPPYQGQESVTFAFSDDASVEKIECMEPNADNNYSVVFSGHQNESGIESAAIMHGTFMGTTVVAELNTCTTTVADIRPATDIITTSCVGRAVSGRNYTAYLVQGGNNGRVEVQLNGFTVEGIEDNHTIQCEYVN